MLDSSLNKQSHVVTVSHFFYFCCWKNVTLNPEFTQVNPGESGWCGGDQEDERGEGARLDQGSSPSHRRRHWFVRHPPTDARLGGQEEGLYGERPCHGHLSKAYPWSPSWIVGILQHRPIHYLFLEINLLNSGQVKKLRNQLVKKKIFVPKYKILNR